MRPPCLITDRQRYTSIAIGCLLLGELFAVAGYSPAPAPQPVGGHQVKPEASAIVSMRGQVFDRNGVILGGNLDSLSWPSIAFVTGGVDENDDGISGIENVYDEVLGKRPGCDLYLTIDARVQGIVEEQVRTLVREHAPRAVFIIMTEPRSGGILAMAQYAVETAGVKEHAAEPSGTQILDYAFEAGSIMKPVTLAGALDAGVITADTTVDCENSEWLYAGRPLHDSGRKYGSLKVPEILQKASNIGTAKIGIMLGRDGLDKVFRRFGFCQATGIDLPGEQAGVYRKLEAWDDLAISRFGMGQGFLVTPLQMVQAYCVLANQGVMPQLHVASHIRDRLNRVDTFFPFPVKGQVLKPETAVEITKALKLVTQEGGVAPKAAVADYEVAGMPGTCNKIENDEYSGTKFVSSFIGYVPADKPAFVLMILVDEPSKGEVAGGTVAAPAFSRTAARVLKEKLLP